MEDELIGLLCCPVTRQPLVKAVHPSPLVEKIKDATEVLTTVDRRRVYPIVNGIPVLLPEAGVPI